MNVLSISKSFFCLLINSLRNSGAKLGQSGKTLVTFSIAVLISQTGFAKSFEEKAKEYAENRLRPSEINEDYKHFREYLNINKTKKQKIQDCGYVLLLIDRELAKEQQYQIKSDETTARLKEIRTEIQTGLNTPCNQVQKDENEVFFSHICKGETEQ